MRRILLLLLVIGVGAGALALSPQAASWLPFPLPWAQGVGGDGPRLRTAEADRGPITAVVAATGTVNPVLSVQVGSQLSGQIRELTADFNTRVTAGQAVARLDTRTIEARVAAAEADLAAAEAASLVAAAQAERAVADLAATRAQLLAAEARADSAVAQLRDAEQELRRAQDLRIRGVNAERDLSRAQFAAERLRADLAAARAAVAQQQAAIQGAEATRAQRAAQLRQVQVDLANATIRAPIDGVVISRNVDLGQTVAASLQAPIMFIIAASLDEMEVWATVDESDIGRIRPGQEVSYTVAAHPGVNLRGRVKDIRLSPTTVQNVVTYTVVVATPNAGGRLLPGMTATLRITTDSRADVLRVPNAALRWRPAGAGGETPAGGGGPIEQALAALPDLSPAQRSDIAAIQAELRERLANLPADAEARRQQAQAARQRAIARFNAVLTTEQRTQLAAARSGGAARGAPGTVHVLEAGSPPRPVAVRTGLTDGTLTEILSGLSEGAQLVVGTERAQASRSASLPGGPRPF